MKGKENLPLFTHSHPRWLLKNPNLLSFFNLLPYLFQLRKWYVTKHLSSLLKTLPPNFNLLDVGCGEGQFLFQFIRSYPEASFLGVDKNESSVHLCQLYADAKRFNNVQVAQSSIETMNLVNAYDVVVCIGVLQYIKEDQKAIESMYQALLPGGKLLLYTPINNRGILPFYKKIVTTYANYETVQDRKRIYSEKMLQNLGKEAGFSVQERAITYGFWGILSNELTNLYLLSIAHLWFPLNIVFAVVFAFLYPFVFLFMLLDFIFPIRKGNGLLLVLRKGSYLGAIILLLLLCFNPERGLAQTPKKAKLDTVKIWPKSEWKGVAGRPYKQNDPVRITVHHEGGKVLTVSDDARQRLKNIQTWGMGPDRKWADVPYHLLIAPDGTVFEGRNPLVVGETNTEYDPSGHLLICFLGNYQQQELDKNLLSVLTNLLADQCIKYGISPKEISTHKDHSTQTTCPGEDIYSYFKSGYIVKEVTKLVKKRSR